MEMRFEPMRAGDLVACAEVFVEAFNGAPWNESWTLDSAREFLGKLMAEPEFWGLCLRGEQGIIGFLCGRITVKGGEKSFFCVELCISPDFQGQKYGSQLFEAARQLLLDEGVSSIGIGTDKNTPAEKFYLRHGLKETRATETDVYMEWRKENAS
ncbi:MAG: GNAT family N-acetyltransferase [Turicibacter sp.]|nr:GNAT family N-acetyltransferase [Turicibacter sp.]